jgi:hypothetical protein
MEEEEGEGEEGGEEEDAVLVLREVVRERGLVGREEGVDHCHPDLGAAAAAAAVAAVAAAVGTVGASAAAAAAHLGGA